MARVPASDRKNAEVRLFVRPTGNSRILRTAVYGDASFAQNPLEVGHGFIHEEVRAGNVADAH